MNLNPNEVYQRLVELGEEWADKYEAVELLDETKKTLLAHLMSDSQEKSSAAKETEALASAEYKHHVKLMVVARKEANKAKVRYDAARVWAELLRTKNANERAVLKQAT